MLHVEGYPESAPFLGVFGPDGAGDQPDARAPWERAGPEASGPAVAEPVCRG
jgi:hypothetical protein